MTHGTDLADVHADLHHFPVTALQYDNGDDDRRWRKLLELL
jgi:hypothetical protein